VDDNPLSLDASLQQLISKYLRHCYNKVGVLETHFLGFHRQRFELERRTPVPGNPCLGSVILEYERCAPSPRQYYPGIIRDGHSLIHNPAPTLLKRSEPTNEMPLKSVEIQFGREPVVRRRGNVQKGNRFLQQHGGFGRCKQYAL